MKRLDNMYVEFESGLEENGGTKLVTTGDTQKTPAKPQVQLQFYQLMSVAFVLSILIYVISIAVIVSKIQSQGALIAKLSVETSYTDTPELIRQLSGPLEEIRTTITNLEAKVARLNGNTTTFESAARISELNVSLEDMRSTITNLTGEVQRTQRNTKDLKDGRPKPTGDDTISSAKVTYEHWGLPSCPSTAELVYKGIMAGGIEDFTGGGSNYLCLPDVPVYAHKVPGVEIYRAPIGATEFRMGENTFSPMAQLHNGDAQCAVCIANRNTVLVMPGQPTCPPDWTFEYGGYMMAARTERKRTEYVCVDVNSVERNGTIYEQRSCSQIFLTESRCAGGGNTGGLPCPPYENGSELPCAVCTK